MPVAESTLKVPVTLFEPVSIRVSREKQRFALHLYGSKLVTQSAVPSAATPPAEPGMVSVATSPPVSGSMREIVPVVGATTQSAPSLTATTFGSGYGRPRSATVAVTFPATGSIRETVLSTSFVTQTDPEAIATPAGCFPTGIAEPTTSEPAEPPAVMSATATPAKAAARALMRLPPV